MNKKILEGKELVKRTVVYTYIDTYSDGEVITSVSKEDLILKDEEKEIVERKELTRSEIYGGYLNMSLSGEIYKLMNSRQLNNVKVTCDGVTKECKVRQSIRNRICGLSWCICDMKIRYRV